METDSRNISEQEFSRGNGSDDGATRQTASQTAEEIQDWLIFQLCERLGLEPDEIDVRAPFDSFGLSSREAVFLSGDMEEWLGRRLPPTLVYEYPTIESLSQYLARQGDASASTTAADAVVAARLEPIAIIGIGCRFPGADGPEAFWQLLRDGCDAVSEVPPDRWDLDALYDPDPEAPGKMNTRFGGFLERVDQFDPQFFGISGREATRMDPQQRLLLEVTWEAVEDAGQVPERLAGTPTGVFIGICSNDYGQIQLGDPELIDGYAGTGNALSIAANRISYMFDFRGPSMAVDTACSSSLVAVHLACQSIWNGESDLALAGGVNLILSPAVTVNFTKAGAMSPDGRCRAFDAEANGYVRSEGAGVVVLKPLSQAQKDGDPVYAVIRGSAINQDGRTNGIMAPSPLAQEAVLKEAYRRAGVSPNEVQYVELHGTGTFLGDPIEARALGNVLAIERPTGHRCAVGSVKTNIGHLEPAAGVAGLIKVALSIKHRTIPPSLHFHEINPHIPLDELPLRVQQRLSPWPEESGPPLAGVSAFGFGGTNCHVVLAAPRTSPPRQDKEEETAFGRAYLLPLSARSPEALRAVARAYCDFLTTDTDTSNLLKNSCATASTEAVPRKSQENTACEQAVAHIHEQDWDFQQAASAEGDDGEPSLHDICYTAAVRRSHHDHRLAVVGHSREELRKHLAAYLQGDATAELASGCKLPNHRQGSILPSLSCGQEERATMLKSIGTLYTLGYHVDFGRLYPAEGQCVRLPRYPWQRSRYWMETKEVDVGSRPSDAQSRGGQPLSEKHLRDWLYEIRWEPKPRRQPEPEISQPEQPGNWLIFADAGGVAQKLAELLTSRGESCVLVRPADGYQRVDEAHYRIRPEHPEDMEQLFEVTLGSDESTYRGVVHLWSLDAPSPEQTTITSLQTAQALGCGSVLHVVHQLAARAQWRESPRLWLVTQGAQPAEPGPVAAAQAPLWGFGRTISQEHAACWGGLIDLDPQAPAGDSAAGLFDEIWVASAEDQVALRQAGRYVARLARKQLPAEGAPPLQWRSDGSYLITGGLGDLGLELARWMVRQGARRLILLGRTKLPPRRDWSRVEQGSRLARQVAAVGELESLGASVHLASVDVADEQQLGSFLEVFRREGWPPIRGVVHAAGIVDKQMLLELDGVGLSSVLRPKVIGGWLLDRLLEEDPLDFFVLFSSASTLLSSPQLAHYAAANAFLDGLAHYRHARGKPALSINWGPWGEVGMAARDLKEGLSMLRGVEAIPPEQALEVLGRLLRQGSAQVGVVRIDWPECWKLYPGLRELPLLEHMTRQRADGSEKMEPPSQAASPLRGELLAMMPEERRPRLESYLLELVAHILGLSARSLDVHQPLEGLGIDSMMALELKNQVEVDLGVAVPLVEFLQGPSIEGFVTVLLDQLTAAPSTPSVPLAAVAASEPAEANAGRFNAGGGITRETAEETLAKLDQLSDEEVTSVLSTLLAEEEGNE